MSPRAAYDNHIEDDEFHPDLRKAARHADIKALEFSLRIAREYNTGRADELAQRLNDLKEDE